MKDIDGYVTKDNLYRVISRIKYKPDIVVDNTTCNIIIEAIYAMPKADVQPVKHGRWITKAEDYYKEWQNSGRSWDDMPYFVTGEHIACSECFTEYDVCIEGIEHWIGCPCCLARMDGDAE